MIPRFIALVAILALLVGAACGDDDETVTAPPPGEEPATTLPSDTTTTTELVPDTDWDECANAADGYSIGYPADWDVDGTEEQGCQYFDPEPVDVGEGTEPDTAVIVNVDPVAFDRAVEGATSGPSVAEVRERTELTVDERRALRVETVASGEGLYPEGTVQYQYIVDLPGERTLVAHTNDALAADIWPDSKGVLDGMIDRLTVETP